MKCGACTVVCPVFQVTGSETYTARGRHHLLKVLTESDRTSAYGEILSKCLLCGACKDACSRGLDTPQLVISSRIGFSKLTGSSFLKHISNKALVQPTLFSGLVKAAQAGEHLLAMLPKNSGLRMRLAFFRDSDLQLPEKGYIESLDSNSEATQAANDNKVCSYFVGCYANHMKVEVAQATDKLVSYTTGSRPFAPRDQACCGLPAHGAGDADMARRLAEQNISAFEITNTPILVSCDSCYSHLNKYPELFEEGSKWQKRAHDFVKRLQEFSNYFDKVLAEQNVEVVEQNKSGRRRIFYHDPCHLRFGNEFTEASRRLLSKFPSVQLIELPGGPQCCGQGGLFQLAHPDLSIKIRDHLLDEFLKLPVDTVTTSCSGCLLQWRQGLASCGKSVEVKHLAELLCELTGIDS